MKRWLALVAFMGVALIATACGHAKPMIGYKAFRATYNEQPMISKQLPSVKGNEVVTVTTKTVKLTVNVQNDKVVAVVLDAGNRRSATATTFAKQQLACLAALDVDAEGFMTKWEAAVKTNADSTQYHGVKFKAEFTKSAQKMTMAAAE